jgi:hypothetical protein
MKIMLILALGLICGCMNLDDKISAARAKNDKDYRAGKISWNEKQRRDEKAIHKYILPPR